MRLDRGLFRDPATMTFPSRLPERSTLPDPERYLPQKVAEVTRDVIKGFPHTKRVGNYLLGKTLGEGSFAKVKESLHILTGERVAIKVIDKKKAKEDPYVRKNMRREGKLLQLVRHRHVIKLYEIMETENCYYLVTELCRGGDLMDHICARKRLEERETKRYIRAVISAVHYLHSAGILHRDLKIENLLLDENKEIKIIDFGLSNSVRVSPTKDGSSLPQELCVTQCGSPAYAAPELLGNRKYGPKVDVWSIGVNMYAMLTGTLPFTVEPFNIKQLHQKMLNGDMNPIPETLSKNGKDFLKKLLSPSPEERISLAEAMQHPWVTDAKNTPMQPAPFPNKLNADDLDNNILKHMSENLDYRMSEAIRLVTNNIPSNATSTYHMFSRKLTRYNTEMRVQGKVAAAEAQLISSSRSTQNTSGYVSRDDGINLAPMGGKDTTKSSDVTVGTRTTEDDSADETVNPVKTQARSSDVSPSRLLRQRHLLGTNNPRQRTFHGHETSQLSIKRTTDEQHTEPLIKLRPSTTKEQEGNHVELSKKLDTSAKLWAAPKTGKKSTFETKTTLHGEFQRKLSVGQSELPAIAEKPSSGHHERKRGKSHRSPHTIRRTSCYFKPMSNYSFRSRDSSRGVIRTGNYTFQPGGPFTDEYGFGTAKPTTQNNTDISVPKVCASAALPDANTDLIGKQNDSGKMVSQSVKVHPRKVLIDIAHYEKYSKNNHADSGKAGTTQSAMVSLLSENKRFGGTIYTTQAKINRPANRNVQLYTRNRSLIKNGDLNVTGERTGVNGSRVATKTRDTWSHDQNTLNKDENQNMPRLDTRSTLSRQNYRLRYRFVQKERLVSIYQWKDKKRKP